MSLRPRQKTAGIGCRLGVQGRCWHSVLSTPQLQELLQEAASSCSSLGAPLPSQSSSDTNRPRRRWVSTAQLLLAMGCCSTNQKTVPASKWHGLNKRRGLWPLKILAFWWDMHPCNFLVTLQASRSMKLFFRRPRHRSSDCHFLLSVLHSQAKISSILVWKIPRTV